jgi:hypothetical protein
MNNLEAAEGRKSHVYTQEEREELEHIVLSWTMTKNEEDMSQRKWGEVVKLIRVYGAWGAPKNESYEHFAIQIGSDRLYHLKFFFAKEDGTIVQNPMGVRLIPESRQNITEQGVGK